MPISDWQVKIERWKQLFGYKPKKEINIEQQEKESTETIERLLENSREAKKAIYAETTFPKTSPETEPNNSDNFEEELVKQNHNIMDLLDDWPNIIQVTDSILKGTSQNTAQLTEVARSFQQKTISFFNGKLPTSQLYLKAALWAKLINQDPAEAIVDFKIAQLHSAEFTKYLELLKDIKQEGKVEDPLLIGQMAKLETLIPKKAKFKDTLFTLQLVRNISGDPNFSLDRLNEFELQLRAASFLRKQNIFNQDLDSRHQLSVLMVEIYNNRIEETALETSCETFLRDFFESETEISQASSSEKPADQQAMTTHLLTNINDFVTAKQFPQVAGSKIFDDLAINKDRVKTTDQAISQVKNSIRKIEDSWTYTIVKTIYGAATQLFSSLGLPDKFRNVFKFSSLQLHETHTQELAKLEKQRADYIHEQKKAKDNADKNIKRQEEVREKYAKYQTLLAKFSVALRPASQNSQLPTNTSSFTSENQAYIPTVSR
ncbi:MAG: hypothetical protein K0S11_1403 [Gammaproteobacteria bacterium]|nr:hypothetical protein [Gammaproteobacteria bacterium]